MNGRFAVSTAGRDTGEVYIIVGSKENVVLLADGIERTMAKPKGKNRKHIEVLDIEPDSRIKEKIAKGNADESIRQAIHHYKKGK